MRLRRLRAAGASRSPGRAAGRAGPGAAPLPPPLAPRPAPPRPRSRAGGEAAGAAGYQRGNGRGDRALPLPARPPPRRGCPETWGPSTPPLRLRGSLGERSEVTLCRNAPVGLHRRVCSERGHSAAAAHPEPWERLSCSRTVCPCLGPQLGVPAPFSPSPECWKHTGADPAMSSACGVTRVDTQGSLDRVGGSSQPPHDWGFHEPRVHCPPHQFISKDCGSWVLMAAPSPC